MFWSLFKRNPADRRNPSSPHQDSVQSQFDIFLALITVSTIVFLDQLTKEYFSKVLLINESIPVIRGIFHFTLVHNTGIAFGLFKNQGVVFIIIPIIAVILLVFNIYYFRESQDSLSRLYIIAFSLILAGAIGNLIDRISLGYVIDFIDFRVWPVFNLADSAITVGAFLILLKCIPSSAR